MFPQEIIRKKRNKMALSHEEINFFIQGLVKGDIADSQVAALTMAIFLNGFSRQETIDLTLSMRDSGDVLHWNLPGPVIDKHSTGGVGDKVSLMLAPILAACGGYVPMIAGRGLGHTGGTLDKLDSIPGYNTHADNFLFKDTVQKIGCAISGQTENLAPADKKIYAIRDVCGTVESIPLITASILAKKLAAGLEYLVMDLKCGKGAFMENETSALDLAGTIVEVANGAGTKTSAVITDMNQVLGKSVGNAVEVREAVEYLQNINVDKRLDIVNRVLCAELLLSSGLCATKVQAENKISEVLENGKALEKFEQMVFSLGGPIDFVEKINHYLPRAAIIRPVFPKEHGYVTAMDVREIGLLITGLKGARTHPDQKLDYAVGLSGFCQIGSYVDAQTPLAMVHAQSEEQFEYAASNLQNLIEIGGEMFSTPVILGEVH